MKKKVILCAISFLYGGYCSATEVNADNASISEATPNLEKKSSKSKQKIKQVYENSTELRIVTRALNSSVVAAKTVTFLLSPSNVGIHSKDDLKGKLIEDIKDQSITLNPLFEIEKEVSAYKKQIEQKIPEINNNTQFNNLGFRPAKPYWSLIYDATDKDVKNGYSLKFGALYSPTHSNKGKNSKSNLDVSCTYISEPRSLDDWKLNDYQLVQHTKVTIVRECTDIAKKHLDSMAQSFAEKQLKDESIN